MVNSGNTHKNISGVFAGMALGAAVTTLSDNVLIGYISSHTSLVDYLSHSPLFKGVSQMLDISDTLFYNNLFGAISVVGISSAYMLASSLASSLLERTIVESDKEVVSEDGLSKIYRNFLNEVETCSDNLIIKNFPRSQIYSRASLSVAAKKVSEHLPSYDFEILELTLDEVVYDYLNEHMDKEDDDVISILSEKELYFMVYSYASKQEDTFFKSFKKPNRAMTILNASTFIGSYVSLGTYIYTKDPLFSLGIGLISGPFSVKSFFEYALDQNTDPLEKKLYDNLQRKLKEDASSI